MTLVIAHRGASAYEPENSLAAFRRAVEMGADGVELDIHQTADGALAVRHDGRIDGRPIGELTLAEVRDTAPLSNGEPVPRLEEALDCLGRAVAAFIEVKTLSPPGDALLFDAIDGAPDPRRCHVHAFDHRIIKRLHAEREDLPVGALTASYPVDPIRPLRDCGARSLWQTRDLVDQDLIDAVHEYGGTLNVWTVDDPDEMRNLIGAGVDGICSNRPDVARRIAG